MTITNLFKTSNSLFIIETEAFKLAGGQINDL